MNQREHRTVHTQVVDAAPRDVYDLVADVTRWPVIFGPTLHVDLLEHADESERFRLWALANGEVKTWTSRRSFDPDGLRIQFRQERSQPPIASMGGEWSFRSLPGGRCEVGLEHLFTAVDGAAEGVAWITAAVGDNSPRELASLARVAGLGVPVDDIVFSFSDTMEVPGSPADAYDFVHRCERWPDVLPHVRRVELRNDPTDVQHLEMETVTADGTVHTTRSVRLCFPSDRIVYKQLVPPPLLLGHSGAWMFGSGPDGAVVTASHSVAVDPVVARERFGGANPLADARQYARDALGANGRATLAHAAAHAGSRSAR